MQNVRFLCAQEKVINVQYTFFQLGMETYSALDLAKMIKSAQFTFSEDLGWLVIIITYKCLLTVKMVMVADPISICHKPLS